MQVSGKDLINNHLTFALYNHTAIWAHDKSKWPQAMRTNGHLLLNAEKMSKQTGAPLQLADSIKLISCKNFLQACRMSSILYLS